MIVIRKSCKIRGQQRWLMELGNQRLNSQRPQKSCVQACVPVTPEFRDKDKDRQPSRNPMLPGLSQGNKGESWGRIPTSSFSLHVSEVGTCIHMPHTHTTHINHLPHTHHYIKFSFNSQPPDSFCQNSFSSEMWSSQVRNRTMHHLSMTVLNIPSQTLGGRTKSRVCQGDATWWGPWQCQGRPKCQNEQSHCADAIYLALNIGDKRGVS